ncbi:DNA translocase FtsK [Nonomuraea glycinis]|uniref:DNA translocase FtsK n=1 Tax=Nonomuraea glycinis TaxID=2047744 RepID=UPI0033B6E720
MDRDPIDLDAEVARRRGRAEWPVLEPATLERARAATAAVEEWNAAYEVAQPVRYWTGFRDGPLAGEPKFSRTRTPAQLLGGHTAVVRMVGEGSCIALSHVDPITEDELERARPVSDLVDDMRDDAPKGGNVEPFIERQLDRLGKTMSDSIDRLEEHIAARAALDAAPRIAAAEQRAAAAEQRAVQAEKACEQRVGDLHTEMARQYRTLEGRYAKVWWLCQHLPGPLRELVSPMPEAWAKEMLTEEWRAMVARRTAPDFDPAAEADLRLLAEAVKLVVESGSAARFQSRMRVGFATAGRLLERMEGLGIVSPPPSGGGRRVREVLAHPEALPHLLASLGVAQGGGWL